MPMQRKKRGPDQIQPSASVKSNNLFAQSKQEEATSKGSNAEVLAPDSTTLELRRKQASQDSFNFGTIPLFANSPANNSSIQRHSQPLLLQTKLTVGAVGDKYEQEADRVASQVVDIINSPETNSPIQREAEEDSEDGLQRKSLTSIQRDDAEEEDLQMKSTIQRAGIQGGPISNELETEIQSEKGKGQVLEPNLQKKMGQTMGAEFSGVRIHTDTKADQLSKAIQAKAFTTGEDIFFQREAYNPSSKGGQELIAHELTHVMQQTDNRVEQRTDTSQRQSKNTLQRDENDKDEKLWGPNAKDQDGKTYPWIVPLHADSYPARTKKGLSQGEKVLDPIPDLKDKDGVTPFRLGFDPSKYPNITTSALEAYVQEMMKQKSVNDSSMVFSAGVMESAPAVGYKFKENESESVYSIHLSPGKKFATLTPVAQVENMQGFMAARRELAGGKLPKNQVGEHCPYHSGTHYPGTPGGGAHMHFYYPQGTPMNYVAKTLDVAETQGVITPKGADEARKAMGLPVRNNLQQDNPQQS
jgi:hypothetical protein